MRMKVGILTLPLWSNYGGILQAYALRQAVEHIGHHAVLFDVRRSEESRIRVQISRLKRHLRRAIRGAHSTWYPDQAELLEISRHTRAFVESNIIARTKCVTVDMVRHLAAEYDFIIIGSDQVWRREYIPDLKTYLFSFPEDKPMRISYSASLGVDDWRFTTKETALFRYSLQRFRAVSVRENSAVALLNEKTGINSIRVCDPTLLLEVGEYRKLMGIPSIKKHQNKQIFAYLLDPDSSRTNGLGRLVEKLGGNVLNIMPASFDSGFKKNKNIYIFPPVENWLRAFNECDFVITDSFHGCVFSVIFNRPFIAVANIERGRTRFESFLETYNLSDRLYSSLGEVDVDRLSPIDWNDVNRIRIVEKQAGLAFLKSALSLRSIE